MSKKLTPAQQQYTELKQQHNDCLLFFRLGDFYELFHDDAKLAHKVLGITLTARNKSAPNPIPMAGIPHHALEKYVPQLINAGIKIAIAEQVGKPVPGQVVDRKVTQIITPGTYIGQERDAQFVLALYQENEVFHLAWGDFTLGTYKTASHIGLELFIAHLHSSGVVELVIQSTSEIKSQLIKEAQVIGITVTQRSLPYDTNTFLKDQLGVSSLAGYGKALEDGREKATALLFDYLSETQKRSLGSIHSLQYEGIQESIYLDEITIKNLEIFSSSYEGSREHSLYGVMDACVSAMGSRLLANYLRAPSMNLQTIIERADRIQYWRDNVHDASGLLQLLKQLPDIPRLLTSLIYKRPSAQKVQNLRNILSNLSSHELFFTSAQHQGVLDEITITQIHKLSSYLKEMIKEEGHMEMKDFIADGVDQEVDRLRQIAYKSDELLLGYQQMLVEHSGVTNIKIKFIKNQGYSLEVTPKDIVQFENIISPESEKLDLVRTQSLKGGQRYSSLYLSELQNSILNASDELVAREGILLRGIIEEIEKECSSLFNLADAVGVLDLSASHALYGLKHEWSRPQMLESGDLSIQGGTHPVVQKYLDMTEQFIPNDLSFTGKDFFHLITGPNMGGKSTYLRQNALIVLLAHAGLFVPAEVANIPLIDGLFARVGSGDALAKNQSTFMTEMIEMSNILHHASSRSFIVLDELGRGTSTYDGLALAKAITVHICQSIGTKSLFATHYHELTSLEGPLHGFSNRHVDVHEDEKRVVFLKKIVAGGASKSYGLDVAKLAGIPHEVNDLAQKYLNELETNKSSPFQQALFTQGSSSTENNVGLEKYEELMSKISGLDLNNMTPLELFHEITLLQKQLVKD